VQFHYFYLLYPLIGAIAGLMSGLLGIGGGIIVVPALAFVFKLAGMPSGYIMHFAIGTSLAVMILTACSSIRAHHALHNILWSVWLRLMPGVVIGVVLGIFFASLLPTLILQRLFGLFLLVISIQIFLLLKPKPTRQLPRWRLMSFVGLLIGAKSGLLGVGGGAITIPFLTYCNVPMRKASGTSVACTLPIAIAGTIGAILVGGHAVPIPYAIGYVYWPAFLAVSIVSVLVAPLGAKLAVHTNTKVLKRLFAVVIFGIGVRLLFF